MFRSWLFTTTLVVGVLLPVSSDPQTGSRPRPSTTPRPKASAPVRVTAVTTLDGVVVGPDGKPVAKALVAARALDDAMAESVVARTDSAGAFHIPLRRSGPQAVRVEAEGLAPYTADRILPGPPLRIALRAGGTIEGVVRDGPTGAIARGAVVEVRDDRVWATRLPWQEGAGVARATSDGQGRYRITGVGSGPQTLTAWARGFGQSPARKVNAPVRADLRLWPAGMIVGTVQSTDGRPVVGAQVLLEPSLLQIATGRLEKTDTTGHFEFLGVDSGTYRVAARHPDFAPAWLPFITVEKNGEADASLTLERPAAVTGRLVDGNGRPVVGRLTVAEIDGTATPPSLSGGWTVETRQDGQFRMEGLPARPATLAVVARGFSSKRVDVSLVPPTDIGDVVLDAGLTIRGHLRDRAGRPVVGAWVRTWAPRRTPQTVPPETLTEDEGAFTVGGLEPGRYTLLVTVAGVGVAQQEADAGADDVEMTLEGVGSITGAVVDESGRPVSTYRITVIPVPPRTPGQLFGTTRTTSVDSADGRFVIEDLPPTAYTLGVTVADHEGASISNVTVPAGGSADVGIVRVLAGGTVRGMVVDATGAPVPGATVTAQGTGRMLMVRGDSSEAATDAGGAFEIRGLRSGTTQIVARHPAYAQGRTTVEIDSARGPSEVRLVLSQGGLVQGRARNRDGAPVEGAVFVAPRGTGFSLRDVTPLASDGTFTVEHVPAGRATVGLMLGPRDLMQTVQEREVDVRDSETVTVEFAVRDIVVTGRLTRGGTPVPGMRILMSQETSIGATMSLSAGSAPPPPGSPQRMTAVTGEDGSYELLVNNPGKTSVLVGTTDRSQQLPKREVEIPDVERYVLDVDLGSFTSISGTVVDAETERPLVRAIVVAAPKDVHPGMAISSTETAPDGRFRLEVDPGDYRLLARFQGYAAATQMLTVGAAGVSDLRLGLTRGLSISGRLVDRNARPVPGIMVRAFQFSAGGITGGGANAMTLPDGSFEMTGLAEGDHTLVARSDAGDYAIAAGVRPGGEPVTMRLQQGGRVQLRVLGSDGNPVSSAFAMVTRIGDMPMAAIGAPFGSDSEGLVEVPTPPGMVTIQATKGNLEGSVTVSVIAGGVATAEARVAPRR